MTARGLFLSPPGTLVLDQLIPDYTLGGNHPHKVDFYIPPGTVSRGMVCLHGGGGTKETFARALGVLNSPTVSVGTVRWGILDTYNMLLVVPQGQACSGVTNAWNPNGVNTYTSGNPIGTPTWSNNFMWSEADDVSFLKDLKTYILSLWPGLGVSLCGHSNGGFMVQRMWYEDNTGAGSYTHFCCCSGPASYYYDSVALPAGVRPFYSQIGGIDSVLDVVDGPAGTGDHFYDAMWYQNPAQLSIADVNEPSPYFYVGEWEQFQKRVTVSGGGTISQGDGVVTSVVVGNVTTWTYTGGTNVLKLVSAGDHGIITQEKCTGLRVLTDWINFIRAT